MRIDTRRLSFSFALLAAALLPVATADGKGGHKSGHSGGHAAGHGEAHAGGQKAGHADAHHADAHHANTHRETRHADANHGNDRHPDEHPADHRHWAGNNWNGNNWNGNNWNGNWNANHWSHPAGWAGLGLWGLGTAGWYGNNWTAIGSPSYVAAPVVDETTNVNTNYVGLGVPYAPGYVPAGVAAESAIVRPGPAVLKADAARAGDRRFNVAPNGPGPRGAAARVPNNRGHR
jgi:hypothetical protein